MEHPREVRLGRDGEAIGREDRGEDGIGRREVLARGTVVDEASQHELGAGQARLRLAAGITPQHGGPEVRAARRHVERTPDAVELVSQLSGILLPRGIVAKERRPAQRAGSG